MFFVISVISCHLLCYKLYILVWTYRKQCCFDLDRGMQTDGRR